MPFKGDLVTTYNFDAIARTRLSDGRTFELGAHGEWMTQDEFDAFDNDEAVPWQNGIEPRLPPI